MAPRRRVLISTKSDNSSFCTHDCYAIPSLPSPLPSPLSSGDSSSGNRLTANITIATVSVALFVLLLVLTYYTVLRRRRRGGDLPAVGNGSAPESEEGESDFPVWHIRTVGLEESAINSITAKPYVAGAGASADCSVCLVNFCEDELVRLLPNCGHIFHVSCIDTWLRAHISCPLCRANIIDSASVLPSCEVGVGSIARISEELEEDGGMTVTDISLDCIESSSIRNREDFLENLSLQERRSSSMDSSLASDLSFRMDPEERSEDGGNLHRAKQGSSFKEERQQKNPLEIGGGSTSGSGKIFFFSRYGRSRSNSVLPL